MTVDEKIKRVVELSKCEVGIAFEPHQGRATWTFNPHTISYTTVEEYIMEAHERSKEPEPLSDVELEMIKRNTIVEITSYSRTPTAYFNVMHWDLEMALDEMIETLEAERKERNS